MTEVEFPSDLRCPISQDLMNDPVVVEHHGQNYYFDRVCVETWKKTPGGDMNPLTNLSGFREAIIKSDVGLKDKVVNFKKENGIDIHSKTEEVELQPFSDYQQIQDDEAEALRLHRELNGPPVGEMSRDEMSRMVIAMMSPSGIRYHEIAVPTAIVNILNDEGVPDSMKDMIFNMIMDIYFPISDGNSVDGTEDIVDEV